MWIIRIYESLFDIDLSFLGVFPVSVKGLCGIITMPMIHGGFDHLLANSIPFFVLSSALFYFYPRIALRIFSSLWILTGFLVWLSGRESYHIGASGLVYGFAAFLFLSGILSKDKGLSAVALLVWFLYGGMLWGVFPMKEEVSWEGHLFGMIVGIVLAFLFRKEIVVIPQEENSPFVEEDFAYKSNTLGAAFEIKYLYKENE